MSEWRHQFPGHGLGQWLPKDDLVVSQIPASTGHASPAAQPTALAEVSPLAPLASWSCEHREPGQEEAPSEVPFLLVMMGFKAPGLLFHFLFFLSVPVCMFMAAILGCDFTRQHGFC